MYEYSYVKNYLQKLVICIAKTRGVAIPSDLELQIANLFGRQQLVMKHTKQWLSARNRRDTSTTRDAASVAASEAPAVPNPNASSPLSMSAANTVPPTPALSTRTSLSLSMSASMSMSSSRHHFADFVQSPTLAHQPSIVGWNNDYRCV